jgi:hypothetical protein
MISCPADLSLSNSHSAKRQELAEKILGKAVIARIIAFALFLLGAKRDSIAITTGIPKNTLLSFLTRMNKVGLGGLYDRRKKEQKSEPLTPKLYHENDGFVISFMQDMQGIVLSKNNPAQSKVIALTLATSGLLSWKQAADIIGSSSSAYMKILGDKLADGDVGAIMDQRRGQAYDYRLGEQEKGDLIIQWAANAVTGKSCSGRALASDLNAKNKNELSDRTIRYHLKKLGLVNKSFSLSSMVESLKKNSKSSYNKQL